MQCASCPKRFHPICAAKARLYIAKSTRVDWKFYCESHPPRDAVYDVQRQAWMTTEILGQLQDLRRSLERGRMLLEMARQRDRQQKRLLNVCKLPFMDASMEIVLKKRPTPAMRDAYFAITGEALTDTPRRRTSQASPVARPSSASKGRARAASTVTVPSDNDDDDSDEDMDESTKPALRRSSRGATPDEPALTRKRLSTAAFAAKEKDRSKRRRVEVEPESPLSDTTLADATNGGRRRSSTQRNSKEAQRAGRGGMSPRELSRRLLRGLESATVASDFDEVVAQSYPELVRPY